MPANRKLGLWSMLGAFLVSCGTPGLLNPTLTATVTVAPAATQTAPPTATEPPAPTSTRAATATATPTSTPTPAPTETSTPVPTATPRNTATPQPAQVAPAATATTTPASSVVVPPPQVFQFDVGGFMQYLDYAHSKYQQMTFIIGAATKQTGSCRAFNQIYGEILGVVAFTGAPEAWQAMVEEYNALRTQVIITIEPVNRVCQAGGGTVDEETDRQMLDFLDRAQNRMYEMLQQAQSMIQ